MSPPAREGTLMWRRWFVALAAMAVTAGLIGWWGPGGPQIVVYPTTDFTRLPVKAGTLERSAPESCASLRQVNGAAQLIEATCGTPASTFRVIARVARESQCVRDADLTYTWATGAQAGVACLDYDWTSDQCLNITKESVGKVDCAQRGAVRPQMAVIGAVDVSYCREGGRAHRVRHFTICTLAGDQDCKGKAHAA